MFKRENLSNVKAKQRSNEYIRQRNVILNFRVKPEEKEKITRRMELSGLTKQEFLIQSLLNQKVICIGNTKSFDVIKKRLLEIENHLENIKIADELDENILESLCMILELYEGLNKPIE